MENPHMMYLVLSVILLILLSVSDIKYRLVPIWPPALYAAILLIAHLLLQDLGLSEIITGLIPGGVLLLLAALMRACVGSGDALVTLACGCVLGFSVEFPALVIALLFSAAYALAQLLRKKLSGKDELPFLPFLAAGHAVMLFAAAVS